MSVMELRIPPFAVAMVLLLVTAACGADAADSLASVVPADSTDDAAVDSSDGSSTTATTAGTEVSVASSVSTVVEDGDQNSGIRSDEDPVPGDPYCLALERFAAVNEAAVGVDSQTESWPEPILAYAESMEAAAALAPPEAAAVLAAYAALIRQASALSYDEFLADTVLVETMIGYELGELAVLEGDLDACEIETGGSISITAEDIEAAAGWVDVSAETYAPCDVVDDETFLVEVFHNGEGNADYELSVVFFKAEGSENEAAAGIEIIPSLRPGERAVKEGWSLFDGTGESCIVTTIRRAASAGDAPEPEDRCTVFGVAESGFVDFQVEIIGTHNGEVWPTVAFVDADGVRRATHQGLIKELSVGELGIVGDTNISGVDDPTVVSCAVVSRINI
jgi:hypothetical protein